MEEKKKKKKTIAFSKLVQFILKVRLASSIIYDSLKLNLAGLFNLWHGGYIDQTRFPSSWLMLFKLCKCSINNEA